jgi:hypothetical protein
MNPGEAFQSRRAVFSDWLREKWWMVRGRDHERLRRGATSPKTACSGWSRVKKAGKPSEPIWVAEWSDDTVSQRKPRSRLSAR